MTGLNTGGGGGGGAVCFRVNYMIDQNKRYKQ